MKNLSAALLTATFSLGLVACSEEERPATDLQPIIENPDPVIEEPYNPGVDPEAKDQAYLPGAEDPSEIPTPNQAEE